MVSKKQVLPWVRQLQARWRVWRRPHAWPPALLSLSVGAIALLIWGRAIGLSLRTPPSPDGGSQPLDGVLPDNPALVNPNSLNPALLDIDTLPVLGALGTLTPSPTPAPSAAPSPPDLTPLLPSDSATLWSGPLLTEARTLPRLSITSPLFLPSVPPSTGEPLPNGAFPSSTPPWMGAFEAGQPLGMGNTPRDRPNLTPQPLPALPNPLADALQRQTAASPPQMSVSERLRMNLEAGYPGQPLAQPVLPPLSMPSGVPNGSIVDVTGVRGDRPSAAPTALPGVIPALPVTVPAVPLPTPRLPVSPERGTVPVELYRAPSPTPAQPEEGVELDFLPFSAGGNPIGNGQINTFSNP